jgi:primosomal protein N' (replication factor Y)
MTRRARRLRFDVADAERNLWQGLRYTLGARFRRQYPIPPYVVDFACVEARLIVEADGSQHGLPGADVVRDRKLSEAGWRVLRFWDNDILQNRIGVLQMIAKALASPAPSDRIAPKAAPTPTLPRRRGRELSER